MTPIASRWLSSAIDSVNVTPFERHQPQEVKVRFVDSQCAGRRVESQDPVLNPRNMRLYKGDLGRHGYTENCKRFQIAMKHGWDKAYGDHTKACRARLEEAILKEPGGGGEARIQNTMERLDRAQELKEGARPGGGRRTSS